jgi:hypothetical protein
VPLGVDGSLGFGSSSNAMSWMRESAPRVDKEGNISNLSLLGQYSAANFNVGADRHGGTLVTDPPASSSVVAAGRASSLMPRTRDAPAGEDTACPATFAREGGQCSRLHRNSK